jgi:hypothetical protein
LSSETEEKIETIDIEAEEEKKRKYEEAKRKSIERLKKYLGELEESEALDILGVEVYNDKCYKLIVGRMVFVGKVISRTKSSLVLEDVYGKRLGVLVSKINMISEYDCEKLEDLKKQLERRRKRESD